MKPSSYLIKNYPNEKKRVQLVNKIIDYYLSDEDIIGYLEISGLSPNLPTKKSTGRKIPTGKKKVAKKGDKTKIKPKKTANKKKAVKKVKKLKKKVNKK